MPPEKTKKRMTQMLNTERQRLEQNLATLTPEDMLLPGVVGEWSVKGAVYDWLSAYAGHDRWAKTHIRKWIKTR